MIQNCLIQREIFVYYQDSTNKDGLISVPLRTIYMKYPVHVVEYSKIKFLHLGAELNMISLIHTPLFL